MPHGWSKTAPTQKIRGCQCFHFQCRVPGCQTYREYGTEKARDTAVRCHFKSIHRDLPFYKHSGINDVVDVVYRRGATPIATIHNRQPIPSPLYSNDNYTGDYTE
jgi:hypothetical protein